MAQVINHQILVVIHGLGGGLCSPSEGLRSVSASSYCYFYHHHHHHHNHHHHSYYYLCEKIVFIGVGLLVCWFVGLFVC